MNIFVDILFVFKMIIMILCLLMFPICTIKLKKADIIKTRTSSLIVWILFIENMSIFTFFLTFLTSFDIYYLSLICVFISIYIIYSFSKTSYS